MYAEHCFPLCGERIANVLLKWCIHARHAFDTHLKFGEVMKLIPKEGQGADYGRDLSGNFHPGSPGSTGVLNPIRRCLLSS